MSSALLDVPAPHEASIPPDLLTADRADAPVPSTSVVLPAYNEEKGLAVVLAKLTRVLDSTFEVIVIDDGSQDRTALVAELHGAHLIRHGSNRGKGAALQTSLAYARGSKIIILDADDTYPVEAVPELADALDRYDMVVGTRQAGRSNISLLNRIGNEVFRHAISLAAGRRVSDPLSGLYGFKSDVLRSMNLTSLGFGIEAEIVIKAGRLGATVVEIPIKYCPRIGQSKLSPVRDGLIIGRTIASIALNRRRERQMPVPSPEPSHVVGATTVVVNDAARVPRRGGPHAALRSDTPSTRPVPAAHGGKRRGTGIMSGVEPPDRAIGDRGPFRPRRILAVELGAPIPPIEAEPASDGTAYTAAWVLVRLHTWPIGIAELDLHDGALSAAALSSGIGAAHGCSIAAHLAADGLPVPAAISPAGVGTPVDLPCLAPRRAFLAHAPRVSIVVPTADRPDLLAACLRDLRAQEYPGFEIIVVDNAPDRSGASAVVQECAGCGDGVPIHYLVEARPGSSIARNRGLLASETAITAFVDADVRVDRHWLAELVRPIAEDERTGCATGLILPAELRTRAQGWMAEWGGYDKGLEPRLYDLEKHRGPGPLYPFQATIFGSGQSMAFRTDVLRRLGGFDLALGVKTRSEGGEDVGALLDVVLSGHRLAYAPGAIVWHPDPREEAAFLRKVQSYGVGLTALMTRTAATRPGSAIAIAARVPAAARYFFGSSSARNDRHSSSFPRWPVWVAELRGMAWGPFAYALSRHSLRRNGRSRRGRGLVSRRRD